MLLAEIHIEAGAQPRAEAAARLPGNRCDRVAVAAGAANALEIDDVHPDVRTELQ